MKDPAPITDLAVSSFKIPTATPESDGTAEWSSTTLVLVELTAAGETGLGYTYAAGAAARVIHDLLKEHVLGQSALDIEKCWGAMIRAVRNAGRPGIASMAISAVDCALWDLKSRLVGLPLVKLLGQVRSSIPVYGSGGFTSYRDRELAEQLSGWVEQGLRSVKMKIGREPERDLERIDCARRAIGPATELMIDANGAFSPKAALRFSSRLAEWRVRWFEEPVRSGWAPPRNG